jgi:hypothetical protein
MTGTDTGAAVEIMKPVVWRNVANPTGDVFKSTILAKESSA